MTDEPVPDAAEAPDALPGVDEAPDAAEAPDADEAPAHHQRRRRWPGYWSFGVAIGMVVTTAVAIGFAINDEAIIALTLTVSAQGLSAIAIVLGLVSVFGRYARPWGIAGLAIGLVLNPVILLYGLSAWGWY